MVAVVTTSVVQLDGNYGISTTTKTDENGNFRFVNLPLGSYKLSIQGSADAVDFGLTEDDNYELVNLSRATV